jgi:hypothetical protein
MPDFYVAQSDGHHRTFLYSLQPDPKLVRYSNQFSTATSVSIFARVVAAIFIALLPLYGGSFNPETPNLQNTFTRPHLRLLGIARHSTFPSILRHLISYRIDTTIVIIGRDQPHCRLSSLSPTRLDHHVGT